MKVLLKREREREREKVEQVSIDMAKQSMSTTTKPINLRNPAVALPVIFARSAYEE